MEMYRLICCTLSIWLCMSRVHGESSLGMGMEVLSTKLTHCSHERAYDMYGAYCAGLRLSEIPSLKSGIEILDFSDNKLNEIQPDTLSSYSSIKYLYLGENQIYRIDKDAFASLPYLQSLDLSNNVILELPDSIFQLPSLRNLYLKNNPLIHLSIGKLHLSRPIKAPLELLDISNCKFKSLPNWGTLPHLLQYNVSHNPLQQLEAQQFAAMCNLKKIDLTKSIEGINLCNMKSSVSWYQYKSINFILDLDDYKKLNSDEFDRCATNETYTEVLNITYARCKQMYSKLQSVHSARRTWLTVTGGLAGFLVGFMLLLYLMHRHNVAQTKAPAEKIKKIVPRNDSDRHAAVPILNTEARDVST
ncbi:tsukushi [Plodia interpunctella]|uniref:tsukushi n=1 Tax=Plodia interpunctella TaxID=58824 RepID=UPI00236824C0|nr:tsukushi [Plodia interpunctella]